MACIELIQELVDGEDCLLCEQVVVTLRWLEPPVLARQRCAMQGILATHVCVGSNHFECICRLLQHHRQDGPDGTGQPSVVGGVVVSLSEPIYTL